MQTPETDEVDEVNERRRVRKGTHSCWECRRRKVKCTLSNPSDTTCTLCRRRGTKCISQNVPDTFDRARGDHRRSTQVKANSRRHVSRDHTNMAACWTFERSAGTSMMIDTANTSELSNMTSIPITPFSMAAENTARAQNMAGQVTPESPARQTSTRTIVSERGWHGNITQALLRALPCQRDLELILARISGNAMLCSLANLKSRSALQEKLPEGDLRQILSMDSNTHPVLLAKHMLYLAAELHYLALDEELNGVVESHRSIMERMVEAAIDLVTTNDMLLGTLDSLECIILEAFFHKDRGNMRRAWVVLRRALTAAQLMGLHRPGLYPVKVIDPNNDLDPKTLWTHILFLEGLLSLLLGLPSSNTSTVSTAIILNDKSITENDLYDFQLVVMSKMLSRNEMGLTNEALEVTRELDLQLLKTAENLPAIFWRPPKFSGMEPGSTEAFWELRRVRDQLCHFTLLTQLHLPYMFCRAHERQREYSSVACVSASREILNRVIAIRTFMPITSCGRLGDFLALVAGMTLMFAHIVSHCHEFMRHVLVHQRLGDRAIVEQILECMESMSLLNEDVMAAKCATLLRRLLLVDADAAQGHKYQAHQVQWTNGDHVDERNVLVITVPYCGTIRIAREGIGPMGSLKMSNRREEGVDETVTIGGIGSVHMNTLESPVSPMEGIPMPTPPANQPMTDTSASQFDALYPDAAAGMDDWVFQGVDTAFFDNLMRSGDWNFGGSTNFT